MGLNQIGLDHRAGRRHPGTANTGLNPQDILICKISERDIRKIMEEQIPPKTLPLRPGIFHLTYLKNPGSVFSWFDPKRDDFAPSNPFKSDWDYC